MNNILPKIWVNTTFYLRGEHEDVTLNDETIFNLRKVIESIRQIPSCETRITVDSNCPLDLDAEIRVTQHLNNTFDLTWKHKGDFGKLLDLGFTHFIYLENDMLMIPGLFKYWVETKNNIGNYGFIPGFIRIEYDCNNVIHCVDISAQQNLDNSINIGGKTYISPTHPYHGMMIMDREMIEHHMSSRGCAWETSSGLYGYPESANGEYIHELVPQGYGHRVLIPVDNIQECFIHHLPNKYVNTPGTHHGKLKFSDLFLNNNQNMSIIRQRFDISKNTPSDINEHMDTLLRYGNECQTIAEFGIRSVVSSYAFALSRPKRLLCLDIETNSNIDRFKAECEMDGVNMEFVLGNTLEYELDDDFDLIFIDTLHNYEQLKAEIQRHHHRAQKYMIFHDTVSFGNKDEFGDGPGLLPAINEFLGQNTGWVIHEIYLNNNGLTVLKRI